jgi:hypothetical protein
MSDGSGPLPQGWTLNKQAIKETQEFWRRRSGVELSVDEAREALHNMASFVEVLSGWAWTSPAVEGGDVHEMSTSCTPAQVAPAKPD